MTARLLWVYFLYSFNFEPCKGFIYSKSKNFKVNSKIEHKQMNQSYDTDNQLEKKQISTNFWMQYSD